VSRALPCEDGCHDEQCKKKTDCTLHRLILRCTIFVFELLPSHFLRVLLLLHIAIVGGAEGIIGSTSLRLEARVESAVPKD
jgi:hypothetical protein